MLSMKSCVFPRDSERSHDSQPCTPSRPSRTLKVKEGQGPGSVDDPRSKEAHVGRLHEKLVPSFRNNLLEDISCIETLFQVNRVDHRDAGSLAGLHVARLVKNPLVVIPHRMMSEVGVHLNLLQPLRQLRLLVHQGDAHVTPEVEGEMVSGEALLRDLLHGHEVHMKDIRMQPHDLQT